MDPWHEFPTSPIWTAEDVHLALSQASPRARCIIRHEIGGVGYDPYSIGAAGELGPVQLHPRGKLPEFYARGWTDPFSPYQAIAYLEDALVRGQGQHWSPISGGMCA